MLQTSPMFFRTEDSVKDEESREIKNKIQELDEQIKEIKDRKLRLIISDYTKEVKEWLEGIEDSLARIFQGAIDVLDDGVSQDAVAQSAESMTRLLERLPEPLAKKVGVTLTESEIKRKNWEALALYVGVPVSFNEGSLHHVVKMQHVFYSTFCEIRHRNVEVFTMYQNDLPLYRALLLQVEAFLYTLMKARKI